MSSVPRQQSVVVPSWSHWISVYSPVTRLPFPQPSMTTPVITACRPVCSTWTSAVKGRFEPNELVGRLDECRRAGVEVENLPGIGPFADGTPDDARHAWPLADHPLREGRGIHI